MVPDPHKFIIQFKIRCQDMHMQECFGEIEKSNRCRLYWRFHTNCTLLGSRGSKFWPHLIQKCFMNSITSDYITLDLKTTGLQLVSKFEKKWPKHEVYFAMSGEDILFNTCNVLLIWLNGRFYSSAATLSSNI